MQAAAAGDPASKDLTALSKKDGFDAAERLSAQLVSALRAAGGDVAAIQVRRSSSKGPRPLERDELPQENDGRMMLDVTLLYVAVAAVTEFNSYKPAVGRSSLTAACVNNATLNANTTTVGIVGMAMRTARNARM